MTYFLEGRPYSLKNSRRTITRGNRTMNVRNAKAEGWLQGARRALKDQHQGPLLEAQHRVSISVYYADRRWWLDQCAIAEAVFDALKGVVVPDDSPRYLAGLEVKPPKVSKQGRAHLEIELEAL